jgi:hypothetical protein
VVVNGEGSGEYFRIVADYLHLNPVRSGRVGGTTGKKLKEWSWSSFPQYAGRRNPDWVETGRVLEAFRLSPEGRGRRAYAGYLEERARDREGTLTDESLGELRRGWYLGEESFAEKLLSRLDGSVKAKRRKGSLRGSAARAHDQAEAERLVKAGLESMGLPSRAKDLAGRGKWLEGKSVLAALVRRKTGVRNGWVAARLGLGSESNVTVALRRVRESRELTKKLAELEEAVGS